MQRLIQEERKERERSARKAWEERRQREMAHEQRWLERQKQLEEEQRLREQQEKDDRALRIARATDKAIEIDRQEAIARGECIPSEGNIYVPTKRLPIAIAECDDSSSDDGYSSGDDGPL
jgi:hypothetical protein